MRIQSLPHIRISRTCRWIERRHAPVADSGNQHGEHGDQNDGGKVPIGKFLSHSIKRHRRDGLNQDDAIEDEVPKSENALEPVGRSNGSRGFHSRVLDYVRMGLSILKRFRSSAGILPAVGQASRLPVAGDK